MTLQSKEPHHVARRMFELLEPICLVTYFAEECNEELAALGHRTYWDGYFASRAAPLGRVPAQVVHAASLRRILGDELVAGTCATASGWGSAADR
jgi:hypothetical protein